MRSLRQVVRSRTYVFALLLSIVLFVANIIALPSFASPENWGGTLLAFAPFALAAAASTPSILSGGGGIDISIGPVISLVNVVLVVQMIPNGLGDAWISIPLLLMLGAVIGAANGFFIAVLRYQPVIATLCAFFIITGLNLKLASTAIPAEPQWPQQLANGFGPIPGAVVTIGAPVMIWIVLSRTTFLSTLLAVGGGDATAYSAGVNVALVRILAYALGGLFAAIGGITLTALLQAADPTLSVQYTLIAIAAVAIGGTPLSGGRGGLLGSILGAASVYLLQNLLTLAHVSAFWLQIVYGALLITGLVLGMQLTREPKPREAT